MVRLRLQQFETGQRIDVAHEALKSALGTDRDAGGTAENAEKRFCLSFSPLPPATESGGR